MEATPFKDLIKGKTEGQLQSPAEVAPELTGQRTLDAELNLAKFASFLFAPSHTREEGRARAKTWAANLDSGQKVLARIIVHTVDRQTLTTFDHRTCLALEKLWWTTPAQPDG